MTEYQWKTVSVVGFDELMQALDRADRKGYMPDAIKDEWEAFNWKPAQPEQEPVAWKHKHIEGVAVTHRPSDIGPHPDRWTPLYKGPSPCPTCEALARTVMLDQTSHDTSPPAQQEPVEYWTVANGWVSEQAEVPAAVWVEPDFWEHCNRVNCGTAYRLPAPGRQPLYASPPAQRTWQGLTDEDIDYLCELAYENDEELILTVQAKLKEKNT